MTTHHNADKASSFRRTAEPSAASVTYAAGKVLLSTTNSFAPDHNPQMAGSDASPPLSRKFARRDLMRQAAIIRSTTFHWALAVAGVFAIFVIVLFGFIYWQTDQYLIVRSDRMIAGQRSRLWDENDRRRRGQCDPTGTVGKPHQKLLVVTLVRGLMKWKFIS
jgi:hypothetical protein